MAPEGGYGGLRDAPLEALLTGFAGPMVLGILRRIDGKLEAPARAWVSARGARSQTLGRMAADPHGDSGTGRRAPRDPAARPLVRAVRLPGVRGHRVPAVLPAGDRGRCVLQADVGQHHPHDGAARRAGRDPRSQEPGARSHAPVGQRFGPAARADPRVLREAAGSPAPDPRRGRRAAGAAARRTCRPGPRSAAFCSGGHLARGSGGPGGGGARSAGGPPRARHPPRVPVRRRSPRTCSAT